MSLDALGDAGTVEVKVKLITLLMVAVLTTAGCHLPPERIAVMDQNQIQSIASERLMRGLADDMFGHAAAQRAAVRDRYFDLNPEWSNQERANISNGTIWIGMTRDQLIASRGLPLRSYRRDWITKRDRGERWRYGTWHHGTSVYLQDGRVESVHRD